MGGMGVLDLENVVASLHDAIPPLPYLRLVFDLQAIDRLPLPDFAGSSFRGLMGHTLKNIGCATRPGIGGCVQCEIPWGCTYGYLFETVAPLGVEPLDGGDEVPRPFVLDPPVGNRVLQPGERFETGLTIFGGGLRFLAHFMYCFEEMGRRGLGQVPARFRVLTCSVLRHDGRREPFFQGGVPHGYMAETPEADLLSHLAEASTEPWRGVELDFLTPTRVVHRGRAVYDPPFHVIVRGLLRRIDAIARLHAGMTLDVDYRSLIDLAEQVETVESTACIYDWERRSNRQGRNLKVTGFVGRVRYGDGAAAFLPLLQAGLVCHVGKSTTFGMGRYDLRVT